jgi:hypothetical protein
VARKAERDAVLLGVRRIQSATVLHIGRGGWTLYRRGGGRLEGWGGAGHPVVRAAILAGVPAFDTRAVAEGDLGELLRGPRPDQDPVASLRHARALGARVWNEPGGGGQGEAGHRGRDR